MKKTGIALVLFFSLILFSSSYAQIPGSPVTMQLGVGIGKVSASGDFGGSTIDYYSGSKYGLSGGVNLQGKVRLGILGFNIVGEVDYAYFSNNGFSEPGQGKVDISQKVLSLKVGPEFKIGIPLFPVTPYIGANIQLNKFSGDVTFNGVAKVPSGTYDMAGASRVGFGINGGVVVSLGGITVDVGAQYNLLNVSGKAWEDANPNKDQRLDSYLSLNDDKDPAYAAGNTDHFIGSSRTISSFAVTATIMFGL